MGQPITLYDPDGDPVTVYGQAQAALMVEQGFTLAPPPVADSDEPAEADEGVLVEAPAPVKQKPARAGRKKA